MLEIKMDDLSKCFCDRFKEINDVDMKPKEIALFLNHYIKLIDSYVGYIERVVTNEYYLLEESFDSKQKDFKTFGAIVIAMEKDESNNLFNKCEELNINKMTKNEFINKLNKIVKIRNMIVHNFFLYLECDNFENKEDFLKYIDGFIEKIKYKNIIDIFNKFGFLEKDNKEGYENQSKKFESERSKIVNPLLSIDSIKSDKWIRNIRKLLDINNEGELE